MNINKNIENINLSSSINKKGFVFPHKNITLRSDRSILRSKIKDVVSSVVDKFKELENRTLDFAKMETSNDTKLEQVKVKKLDTKLALILMFVFIGLYGSAYLLIDKWRQMRENKRVEEALKKYESDKQEYINTGFTR